MEKISVDFENCYGIKALKHEFETSEGRAFLIYASNGAMKTSFAKIFADISRGEKPSDRIFHHRTTKYSITDENDKDIASQRIFVVEPYQESFESTRTATLLVNQDLRIQYEKSVESISEKVDQVIEKLARVSGVKKNAKHELADTYGYKEKDILELLEQIASTLKGGDNPGLDGISYTEIFNEKVSSFLSNDEIRRQLKEYVERYEELIKKSAYFRAGLFDHNNAATVGRSLKDNGFFEAKHVVMLADQNSQKTEVVSQQELDAVIGAEKQKILSDPILAKRFDVIDKAITKNADLKQFRRYLENHRELLPELANLNQLKKKLWVSYFFTASTELASFLSTYQTEKKEIAEIIEKAKKEETEWRTVVSIFHERFSVPFSLRVENQDDVILKNETPSLIFQYNDEEDEQEIGRKELLNVLSTGEKRALYLLNIIFDIRALEKEPEDTILILDDIADSFDYKNKYAIVEYLKAILETGKFVIIILTHNFDFFRTVQSRLNIGRNKNCLMAIRSNEGIALRRAEYLNPFNYWRDNLHNNQKLLIATIPMVRNLVEYMRGENSTDFIFLTSLLHKKADTNQITIKELTNVFNHILGTPSPDNSEKVVDIIFKQADSCGCAPESINLENKIILSIAIRLLADDLMIKKINNPSVTDNFTKNQTCELFTLFKTNFPNDKNVISMLEKVVLMTPEAIHLNSFMYEPIIDLSECHLKDLYNDLKSIVADIDGI
jgi:hypothetical protein